MINPDQPDNHPGEVLVTVVIPVKNGEATIEPCLRSILSQAVPGGVEVLVIDSGSSDATCEIVSRFPVRLHRISPAEFNHGETRNLGVALAKGQYVAMTVQDAILVGDNWIKCMLEHFSDPLVAGVCGLQFIPHDLDKNPVAWFRPHSSLAPRRVCYAPPGQFRSLNPQLQYESCRWDDVAAIYRRSALQRLPFRSVSFAEDMLWARDALDHGFALVYEPRAQVAHYHHETFAFRFRRSLAELYFAYRCFHYIPRGRSFVLSTLRAGYQLHREKKVQWRRKPGWFVYNVKLHLADLLGRALTTLMLVVRGEAGLKKNHTFWCATPPQALSRSTHSRGHT